MHLQVGLCIFQRWAEKPSPCQDAGTARTHAQPGGSDPFPEIAILNTGWHDIGFFGGFKLNLRYVVPLGTEVQFFEALLQEELVKNVKIQSYAT